MAARPDDLAYTLDDRPPAGRLLFLGLQYAILICVYLMLLVVVAHAAKLSPDAAQSLISLGLVAAAAATVAQAWNGRFFGSGFLAPPVFSAIYLGPCIIAAERGGLPAVAGMTIFAGLVELVLSRSLTRLRVIFQPLVTGFTIFVVGIQLGLVAIARALDIPGRDTADFTAGILVGVATFAVCAGLSVWGAGVLKLMSALIGAVLGTAAALAAGIFTPATLGAVGAAPWLALPDLTHIGYAFDLSLVPVFVAAAVAATIRTIGVVTTCQRLNDADWKRPDVANLSRGVVGDGLGAIASGLLGVMGQSSSPSLVGLSRATGATSRVIAWATAAILLVFAFIPKISSAMLSIPLEVVGGVLLFTASFMITSGIQVMAIRSIDVRGGFAISVALLLGLTAQLKPAFFAGLPGVLRLLASDLLTLSLATVAALTLLFRIGARRHDTVAWRAEDGSLVDFSALLDRENKAWKIGDELVGRAKVSVSDLVRHLGEGHYLDEPRTMTASFDGLELCVDLTYRGRAVHLSLQNDPTEMIHEETGTASGLGYFLLGVHADRASVAIRGDDVHLRLWFAA